jgi:hypothetical protein
MTMTIRESASRHLAAGVDDRDELARLIESDTGKAPSRLTLKDYHERFRRHGAEWVAIELKRNRKKNLRWAMESPARKLLSRCHSSALTRDQECTITIEFIEQMLAPMVCSVTGLPLTWEHDGSTRANPWAPSIDRIDCSLGYVPGNVRVVCWAFNMMRSDWPDEVIMTVVKSLANRASA